MKRHKGLSALQQQEREAFCREVLEHLSELVEGEAPVQLDARVREVFGDCDCYAAYKATLGATIQLANECAQEQPQAAWMDDDAFAACVQRVRERLAGG